MGSIGFKLLSSLPSAPVSCATLSSPTSMEEKICRALKLTKLRQQSFSRSLDEIHEQASSILALQRKNIETHFDTTFISIEDSAKELHTKERRLEEREKEVDSKEKEFEERCEEFIKLRDAEVEEHYREIELKEKDFEDRRREVELERKKLEGRRKEVEEEEELVRKKFAYEIELKEKEIEERRRELEMERKKLVEKIKLKEEKIEEWRKEIEVERKKLVEGIESREKEIEERQKEIEVERKKHDEEATIKPHVRKEATKLAFLWMTKMTVDNQHRLDVLGFFFLLASYGLASAFDSDELISRLVIIAGNRQTPEFLRVLELGDKIPGFIQNLILKKQPMEVIRFIFAFEMVNRFPLETILRDYLTGSKIAARKIRRSNSFEGLVESVNRRVADLMAVLKCVEEYKLETVFSPNTLKQQIKDVERQLSIRKTKLPDLDSKSPQPNLREKNRLALKSAASAPVLPSKSVSATKPALNSTMVVACTATSTIPITVPSPPPTAASIASPFTVTSLGPITASTANPVAPIDVTSPSTTAAAATSPIAVTSPSITASTTGSRVAPPSSTSASPSASVPKTEPVCQGGNKRRQAQYQGSDKHPQEQHQGGKKRPRIVKSSEAPIRAPSLQSTGIAPLVFVPLQRAEGPFINPNAPYLNTFSGHYYGGGYRPPTYR